MCGLCGIAGPGVVLRDLDIFYDLLWVTGLRGHHSTGVFTYKPSAIPKNRYLLTKRVQPSPSFVLQDQETKYENRVVNSVMNYLIMGHCRYATVGGVKPENAHPFDTGRYVGTHNGTLVDSKYLGKKKTDSLLMFEQMEKDGIGPVLEDLEYKSAYSVVIFDKHRKDLSFASNGERPLYLAFNKERSVLYYASELHALDFVAKRNGVKMDFFYVPDNEIHTINVHDIKSSKNVFDTTRITRKAKPPSKVEMTGWDMMDWNQDPIPHSMVDQILGGKKGLEGFCSSCGTILYGKTLAEANSYKFDGKTYYTCSSCLGDSVEEVKVG